MLTRVDQRRIALAAVFLSGTTAGALAQQVCEPEAFREVISSTSASITKLHEANSTIFQQNLGKLRALAGWSDAEYAAKATPFVKDEVTASIDAANDALLAKVRSLQAADAGTAAGRCAMLAEVKSAMQLVVSNTAAKWQHMLEKAAQAATRPMTAGFTQ